MLKHSWTWLTSENQYFNDQTSKYWYFGEVSQAEKFPAPCCKEYFLLFQCDYSTHLRNALNIRNSYFESWYSLTSCQPCAMQASNFFVDKNVFEKKTIMLIIYSSVDFCFLSFTVILILNFYCIMFEWKIAGVSSLTKEICW